MRLPVPANRAFALLLAFLALLPGVARAADAAVPPAIPGPPALSDLHARMARHERQFYTFNARPFGVSLDAIAKGAEGRAAIEAFLKQDAVTDFAAFDGHHPYARIADYGEHGDLGFFGGVALAATAYEYRVLKRDGADATTLAAARARLIRAVNAWHVFYVVTGGNGVVARGIRRVGQDDLGDPGAPDIPGAVPDAVPLADGDGPLPRPKDNGSERADLSAGALPAGRWTWIDSASKDQLVGQLFGMVALHDALADEPEAAALLARMKEDALGIFQVLRTKRDILGLEGCSGEGEYDLIIMDADGRPTMYHDLNPLSMEKIYLPEGSSQFNVFNLFMAYAILKSIHHVTGDAEVEQYLYTELLGNRGYLDKMRAFDGPDAFSYLYMGLDTNTDVPDMTGVALFLGLYLETDDVVRSALRRFLEDGWWAPANEPFAASKSKQPLWHAFYIAVSQQDREDLGGDLAGLLSRFPAGDPATGGYWEDPRINCDEAELTAKECLAVDGKTTIRIAGLDRNGKPIATEALDPSIRPASDFNARSNSFSPNGGGYTMLLCPGGDLLAAYWMARYFPSSGTPLRSPFARVHGPVPGEGDPVPESAEPLPDVGTDESPADVTTTDLPATDLPATDLPATDVGADVPPAGDPGPADVPAADVPSTDPGGHLGGGGGCTAGAVPGGMAAVPLLLAMATRVGRRRRA
jgi:hypothetical protein